MLEDIESMAEHVGRTSLTLTSGVGLQVANRIYRAMAGALPWPEMKRRDVTIATTTAGTGTYEWVKRPIFSDVLALEIQDGDDQNRYKLIPPAPDEVRWNLAGNKSNASVPDYYDRYVQNDGANYVELRPSPLYGSKTIRARGIIEPPELTAAESMTAFIQASADDALAHMIAADYLDTDGFAADADRQLSKAGTILQRLFGRDVAPLELPAQIVRG